MPAPNPGAEERLRARLAAPAATEDAEHPRTWNPRKGDGPETLIGTLEHVATVETKYGPTGIATILDAGGERWAVWLSSKTIQSEWEREAPQVGEALAVQFCGERETQDGQRRYPVFRVVVDRPGEGATSAERWGAEAPW